MSGDKSKKHNPSKSQDLRSKDNKSKPQKDAKKGKDKDGDEEMTVVMPPSKSTGADPNSDVTANGTSDEKEQEIIDPKVKASNGMQHSVFSNSLTDSAQTSRQMWACWSEPSANSTLASHFECFGRYPQFGNNYLPTFS